jgi:hypothetical protein
MAKWIEWSEEQKKVWDEWVNSRPDVVKELCLKFPADRLYRIKDSGDRGTIHSYDEDGTMTLIIDGTYSQVIFPKNVFGLNPEDIEECDLPKEELPGIDGNDPMPIIKIDQSFGKGGV